MRAVETSGVLVAIGGLAGSGKGRLAELIAGRIGARRIDVSSDLEPFPESIIPYANALYEAGSLLTTGVPRIVIAGPFHTRDARRALMRLASGTRSALLYVECSANEFVRHRRLRRRFVSGPEPLTAPEAALWADRLVSDDSLFERTGVEIPRAAQILIDTTVGIDIWGALAASRVEGWATEDLLAPMLAGQALSTG